MRVTLASKLASLGLGSLGAATVLLLMSPNPPSQQADWPPPKAMILNHFELHPWPGAPSTGGIYTVLSVPQDRWLTITGASSYATGLFWAESNGGVLTRKGFVATAVGDAISGPTAPEASPVWCSGPIGWVFRPGSSVVIEHPAGAAFNVAQVSLIGYYSRN